MTFNHDQLRSYIISQHLQSYINYHHLQSYSNYEHLESYVMYTILQLFNYASMQVCKYASRQVCNSVTWISNSWPNTNILSKENFTKYEYRIYSFPNSLPNMNILFVPLNLTKHKYRIQLYLTTQLNTNIEYIQKKKIECSYLKIWYSVPIILIFDYIRVTLICK